MDGHTRTKDDILKAIKKCHSDIAELSEKHNLPALSNDTEQPNSFPADAP
jgi:hypothetical protein